MGMNRTFVVRGVGQSLAVAVGAALCFQTAVSASPLALSGDQSPTHESAFTLDFGALGGVASARIAQTRFALEVDAVQGTARFAEYDQEVEPLTLPGGFSTGNLRVEVVAGSSVGTFDAFTGEFNTREEYAIHFDGDLSAFGLVSPVILPSTSAGTLSVSAVDGGTVVLQWVGNSLLPNPFVPGTFIPFEYTCSVNGAFAPAAASLVQLALLPQVASLGLAPRLEGSLLGRLESARDAIDAGNFGGAAFDLNSFIAQVERQRNRALSDEVADQLVSDARGAVALLGAGNPVGVSAQ